MEDVLQAGADAEAAQDGDALSGASVLHARAVALAMRQDGGPAPTGLQVLQFVVGEQTFAVETTFVSEVFPVGDVAVIPGTPDFVLGVVSVRGTIVSVVDLRPLFGAPAEGDRAPGTVIVLRAGAMEFSVAADAISAVRDLPREAVQRSLARLAGTSEDYVIGVTLGRVVVLDAAKLLSDPRLVVRHGAGSGGTTMGGPA